MLSKENRLIIKDLKGEYRQFAQKLAKEVFGRCDGNKAINETLGEMLFTLKEAQEEGRSFGEVIPEPDTTIKDTVLLFPMKKLTHSALIGILSAMAAVLLAAGIFALVFQPVALEPVLSIYFDSAHNSIYWVGVEKATGYEVYVDGEKAGETTSSYFFLEGDPVLANNMKVTVIAKGDWLHRDSSHHKYFREGVLVQTKYPRYQLSIHGYVDKDADGFNQYTVYANDVPFYPFIRISNSSYDGSRVEICTFTPEYNFYGLIREPNFAGVVMTDSEKNSYDHRRPVFFRAQREYIFYITNPNAWAWDMEIRIASIFDFPENVLLPYGKTVFAAAPYESTDSAYGNRSWGEYGKLTYPVYRAAGENSPIQFSRYDFLYANGTDYSKVIYPGFQIKQGDTFGYTSETFESEKYETLRYIFADNTSRQETALILEPVVKDVEYLESGKMTVPKGVFAIRTLGYEEESPRDIPPMLYLRFLAKDVTDGGHVYSYLTDNWLDCYTTGGTFLPPNTNYATHHPFFVSQWAQDFDHVFVFYAEREMELEYSCFLAEEHTVTIDGDGTYTPEGGLCVLEVHGNHVLQGDHFYYDANSIGNAFYTDLYLVDFKDARRLVTDFSTEQRRIFCFIPDGVEITAIKI